MKKILLLLIAGLMFASCEPAVVKESRKFYQEYFNYILKDPSSLEIHSAKYATDGHFLVQWDIDYSAKNSFGGKVRKQIKLETFGEYFKVDGELYFKSTIKQ